MIPIDFERSWEYENGFYLTSDTSRSAKMIAQYELLKRVIGLPGHIVECGVFKGASLARLATFRAIFGASHARRIIGFDTFDQFPETAFDLDTAERAAFLDEAGTTSISVEELRAVLLHKGVAENVDLVAGDIRQTVPLYLERHPELRIALLNLDTDLHEPAVVVLEHLYPRLVPGGVLMVDDYGAFAGESTAIDDYFGTALRIESFPWAHSPSFIIKEPGVAHSIRRQGEPVDKLLVGTD